MKFCREYPAKLDPLSTPLTVFPYALIHRFRIGRLISPLHPHTASMFPRQSVPSAVTRLAVFQAGVVSATQAEQAGLTHHVIARLIETGRWTRLARGHYYVDPGEPPWAALAFAGTLAGGDGARLGPWASGHVVGLVQKAPLPIDILVSRSIQRHRQHGRWAFTREHPGCRSPATTGSPPRLIAEDIVLDLTSSGGDGNTVSIVTDALRMRLTTPTRLRKALAARIRHPHRKLLTDLLADAEGIESALELAYLRDVERAHDLPRAMRNKVRAGQPYRRDVDYEDYGVLVELDGRRGHEGSGRFRDMRRDNYHSLLGRITLRYGWWDVAECPCEVAYQVYVALVARGHAGPFNRCRLCLAIPR